MKCNIFLLAICCLLTILPARANPLPREIVVSGVEFVHIPAGWVWWSVRTSNQQNGEPDQDNKAIGKPRMVKVWVDGFYIAKFEARARDFQRYMAERPATDPLHNDYQRGTTQGCSVRKDDAGTYFLVAPEKDLPATHLTWQLADGMARWLGFRLPTEAEWTRAARGDDTRFWPWGDEYPDDTFAGYEGGMDCNPTPVDTYPNGVSPFGVYGQAGNVWEFVADWYNARFYFGLKDGDRNPHSTIPLEARSDNFGEIRPLKIVKGGRWGSGAGQIGIHSWTTTGIDEPFQCYGTRFALDESLVAKILQENR